MIPFQTILALLTLLMMLCSCSQVAPPHPGTTAESQTENTLNKPDRGTSGLPNADGSPTSTPTDAGPAAQLIDVQTIATDSEGLGKLSLNGPGAKTIYQLMAVAGLADPIGQHPLRMLKKGQQFSCQQSHAGFECDFLIQYADGSIANLQTPEEVVAFDPELTQPTPDTGNEYTLINTIRINAPSAGPKVRLSVLSDQAKVIYDALTLPEVVLAADATYDVGGAKNGQGITCGKQTPKSDHVTTYYCDIYMDTILGTIDKPTL
jgi:hypothetical protein